MSGYLNKEGILNILQAQNPQQPVQNSEVSLEQALMNLILNPVRMSINRTQLINSQNPGIISERQEGSRINEAGFIEDLTQENFYQLDDGTSMSGVVHCQTCNGLVKEENIKRCGCGKTCCIRPGCAKGSESENKWYCCSWHEFLSFLGVNLR